MELKHCQNCGGELKPGFLLGKHNRIRWSASAKGMTLFHGVPLIRLEQGFWRRRQWWFYAPSIAAVRCSKCRLVTFSYTNVEQENPKNERRVSMAVAVILIGSGIAVGGLAIWMAAIQSELSLLLLLLLGLIALLIIAIGGIFLQHVFDLRRSDK